MTRAIHLAMLFSLKCFFYIKNRVVSCIFYRYLQRVFHFTYLKYHGVETQFGNVTLLGLPIIRKHKNSKIVIGKGVTLVSTSHGNIAGINHPVILATLSEGAVIELRDRVGISGSSLCAVKRVTMGENSGLGANSSIYDTDFHSPGAWSKKKGGILDAAAKEVRIGENVWIASNVIVLKGVTVGNGAVIGAGAVVRNDVQEHTLVIGNPATEVRKIGKKAATSSERE